MKDFKTGDKVVCKDVSGFDMSHLTLDSVYEVRCCEGPNIWLIGVAGSTKVWRFELYKEKS